VDTHNSLRADDSGHRTNRPTFVSILDQRPVLPNPPGPRVATGSSSTRVKFVVGTSTITNWAIRSPGWMS